MLVRVALALLMMGSVAGAQDQKADPKLDSKRLAVDLVQAELSVCMAYYTFVRGCAIERSEINLASQSTETVDKLRKYAFQAGQTINMDADAMLSRLKIALEQQGKLLEGNCENMPKLTAAYGERCKKIADDPQAVLDQYLKK